MSMPLRPMPVGFADVADHGIDFLLKRFNCHYRQIVRWRRELGIDPESIKYRNTSRPVAQIKDGKVVATYRSIGDAARRLGKYPSNIRNCAAGMIHQAYGFQWVYLDERSENDRLHETQP